MMLRAMTLRAVSTCVVLALGIPGWQTTVLAGEPRPPSRQPVSAAITEAGFVKDAAEAGIAELGLGKLALERARNPDVRQFAQRVVADHSNANNELTDLAKGLNVEVPKQMNAEQRNTMARLETLSGAAFDREYMRAMVTNHARDVALFRSYSQRGKNEGLKSWAAKILPTLRKHQQLAGATAAKVGAS